MVDFSTFAVPIAAQDPLSTAASSGSFFSGTPIAVSTLTDGGVRCEWAPGLPEYYPSAQDRVYPESLLEVTVLPDTRSALDAAEFPIQQSSLSDCNYFEDFSYCGVEQAVGEYWVLIEMVGTSESGWSAISNAIVSRVGQLPASRPSERSTAGLDPECASVLDQGNTLATYFGGIDIEPNQRSGRGYSLSVLTDTALGYWTCQYYDSAADYTNTPVTEQALASLSVEVLPSAGWAVKNLAEDPANPFTVKSLELSAGETNTSGYIRCNPVQGAALGWTRCSVQLAVDGDWISVEAHGGASAEQAAAEIAAEVVARVQTP